MKILVLTAHYPPTQGGMADYAARFCEELERHGHSVGVISTASSSRKVKPVPLGGPWSLRSYSKLRREILRVQPDVIFVLYTPYAFNRRGPGLPVSLLLFAIRRSTKIPVVTYAHELYISWSQSYLRAPWYAAQRIAIAILVSLSEKFLVLTEARRLRLAQVFPWWKSRLGMVPVTPTLDTETIDPNWRAAHGIADGVFLISTMGLDHPEKGARLLADLADGLAAAGINFRYVTIGGIKVDHPHVESWGYVSAHDAMNLIAASDLFVVPYDDGVSGRRSTAQNALAVGTPVLTTRGENTDPALFREDALAMVPAKDPSALIDKAVDLLIHSEKLAALRVNGKKLGEEVFSWEEHINSWEAILEDAISSNASNRII